MIYSSFCDVPTPFDYDFDGSQSIEWTNVAAGEAAMIIIPNPAREALETANYIVIWISDELLLSVGTVGFHWRYYHRVATSPAGLNPPPCGMSKYIII